LNTFISYNPNFGSPQTISVATVVMPWTQYTDQIQAATITLKNESSTETVVCLFDVSQDGASPDLTKRYQLKAVPLSSASLEVGWPTLYAWRRLTAYTQSGNPAVVDVQNKLANRYENPSRR